MVKQRKHSIIIGMVILVFAMFITGFILHKGTTMVMAEDSEEIQTLGGIEFRLTEKTAYIDTVSTEGVVFQFKLVDNSDSQSRIKLGEEFKYKDQNGNLITTKATVNVLKSLLDLEFTDSNGDKKIEYQIDENLEGYYASYDFQITIYASKCDSNGFNVKLYVKDRPSIKAVANITIPVPTISLNASSITLLHGNYTPLEATVTGLSDSTVSWYMGEYDSSNDPTTVPSDSDITKGLAYQYTSGAHRFKETSSPTGTTHNVVCEDGANGSSIAVAYITYKVYDSSSSSYVTKVKRAYCIFTSSGGLTFSGPNTVYLGNKITLTVSTTGFNICAANQLTWKAVDESGNETDAVSITPFVNSYNKIYVNALKPIGDDDVTIIASANGFTASWKVNIPNPTVTYKETSLSIRAGNSKTMTVTEVGLSENATIGWEETDVNGNTIKDSEKILSLTTYSDDAKIKLEPTDYGATYITAFIYEPLYSDGDNAGCFKKTWKVTVPSPTIRLSSSLELNYGATKKVSASWSNAFSGTEIQWKVVMKNGCDSDNKNIRIIEGEDVDSKYCTIKSLNSKGSGSYCKLCAYITNNSGDIIVSKAYTVVKVKAAKIYTNSDTVSITKGNTKSVSVSTSNVDSSVDISWKSSKKDVATVKKSASNSKSATIIAKKKGKTKITAQLPNGKNCTITIKVTNT